MADTLTTQDGVPSLSAGSRTVFDRLPAELLGLILAHSDSPKDLIAFISTCQRTHRVFRGSKTQILEAVVRNAFPSTLLWEAVAACKTWPLKAAYDHGQWILLLPAQQWFLREYWLSPSSDRVSLKEPGLLPALYRLWWVLDRFIRNFYDDAMHNIATEIDGSGRRPGWDRPIDSHEHYRIQRAFLRFELYRQLFPPVDPGNPTNDWPYRSTHQYSPSLFLRQLPHWERGELLAVTQHLCRRVLDLHLSIRRQLMKIVPSQAPSLESRVGPHVFAAAECCRKLGLYERMLIFPEDLEPFNRHYNVIVRLGLPFLSWLQNQPLANQIYILGLHFACTRPKTLESEISFIPRSDMCLYKWKDAMESSGMTGPGSGWRELFQERAREEGLSATMLCSSKSLLPRRMLQKMGYLFWSEDRFHRISFPPLEPSDRGTTQEFKIYYKPEESKALLTSLRTCATQSERFEDVWRILQHSEWMADHAESFKKSYPPRSVMHCIPIYYGIIMNDEESAQLARRFMRERRELVNELVTKLSDIWMELVMTGPR